MPNEPTLQTTTKQKEKPKFIRIIIWLGFLTLLILIIFMIFGYLDNRPKAESPLPPPINVSVSQLENGTLIPSFEFIGEVRAKQLAQIAPEINAVRILSIEADVGVKVKKGDILAFLDDKSLSYQKQQAQSAYEQALDEYNRKSRLGIQGGISQEELTIKSIALKSAKARLDDAELMLSKAQLTSPVDGIIISKNKEVGTLTNINEAMFTIAVNQETEFVANIPENQLSLFAVSQEAKLFLSGYDKEFTATINRIEPLIDSTSRTANIYLQFQEPQFHPIGLFGTARISLPAVQGVIVPTTAILLDENGHFLWYVDDAKRVAKVYIKEIIRQGNLAIIEIDNSLNTMTNTKIIPALSQANILLRAGSLVNEGDLVTPSPMQTSQSATDKKG